MPEQTVAAGSSVILAPCAFARAGWSFAGWATIEAVEVVYADGAGFTMGAADITLYGKWRSTYYHVDDKTYAIHGGGAEIRQDALEPAILNALLEYKPPTR